MSGPTMHAAVTRKFNLGNWESKEITIGVSQVPLHATDAMVASMLQTANRVVGAIEAHIDAEFNHRNPRAFDGEPIAIQPQPEISGQAHSWEDFGVHSSEAGAVRQSPRPEEPRPAPRATGGGVPAPIPDESEVTINTAHVFGVDVSLPPAELLLQPIEQTDPNGGQGRQMKYLNTALTSAGFVDADRHWASLAIIKEVYGGMARTSLTSLKELTKGEAHVIADFFMSAGEAEISQLRSATSALKGQLVMKSDGECCDLFPFCDCPGTIDINLTRRPVHV